MSVWLVAAVRARAVHARVAPRSAARAPIGFDPRRGRIPATLLPQADHEEPYTRIPGIMADGAQRRPKDVYDDHKGFTGRVLQKMSGTAPQPALNLHAVAAHPEKASPADLRELRDAIQRRQLVEDVMELKGAFFPGCVSLATYTADACTLTRAPAACRLDAIKKANEAHDTSVTLNERVQEMQKRHIQDVRTLYQWQAQDYYDEMLDLAQSKPDIGDLGAEVRTECHRAPYYSSPQRRPRPFD